MRARSGPVTRPSRLCTAALILISGMAGARAQDIESFFQDLDRTDAVAISPDPTEVAPKASPPQAAPAASVALQPKPGPAVKTPAAPDAADKARPRDQTSGAPTGSQSLAGSAPDHARAAPAILPSPAPSQIGATPKPQAAETADVGPPGREPASGPEAAKPSTEPSSKPSIEPSIEPLPPLNAAVKADLDKRDLTEPRGAKAGERRKEDKAIAFFYATRGFSPIWSKDGHPVDAVASVIQRLGRAGDDALDDVDGPIGLTTQGSLEAIAASDVELTEAVVSYARQATGSRVDPKEIGPLIGLRPKLADPAEVLEPLADAGDNAGDELQALNPIDPRYAALRTKLDELRANRTSAAAGGPPIAPGPTLHVGMRDARVPALRARFHLGPGVGSKPDERRYDSLVAEAVAHYQRTNGLPPSGALTGETVAALSGKRLSPLEGTLVANMEMWRWMPRDLGANHIEVNVPDFLVTVYHDGTALSQHRVVVGKVDTPTPLFSNAVKYLIVNPYWNVPQSIIKKEMLPKGGGDLSYLEGRGYSVVWHGGQWVVRQLPGDKNALGRIKFLFPNDYAVYLHDTPSKALFSVAKRAFSHGCVRVDQPFSFAESVLADATAAGAHGHWSEGRLEGMIGDKERYVNLPTPLPIHIEYFTASVDPTLGTVKLRDDVYGYARAVAVALGQSGQPAMVAARKPRLVAEHVRRKAPDAVVDDGLDPR